MTPEDGPDETAAGYVPDRPGRLASPGDEVPVGATTLQVVEVPDRRVLRVAVHRSFPTDD